MRDDVGIHSGLVGKVLHELAGPELTGRVTAGRAQWWIAGEGMPVLVNIVPPHKVRVNTFRNLYLLPRAHIVFSAAFVLKIPFILCTH
jgi:hypothetical protein